MKTEIEDNIGGLMAKDHFYSLLAEMDYNNLSMNVSIPLIQKIHNELKAVTEITDDIAYEYYAKLLLPFYILLRTPVNHKVLHEEVLDNDIKFVFYGSRKDRFKLPKEFKTDRHNSMNFELMRKKVENFKNCGERIINSLEQMVKDNEKSDSEIINLI